MDRIEDVIKKPWGYEQVYANEDSDSEITKKNLVVFASQSISLQYHEKRFESWKILHGECRIFIKDTWYLGLPGTIWQIGPRIKHRVRANTHTVIEEISEGYDPDDIVRIEDDYGRIPS
jgi:mannose-6-phosphate isomerase-like protein (cupin superfamily)